VGGPTGSDLSCQGAGPTGSDLSCQGAELTVSQWVSQWEGQ